MLCFALLLALLRGSFVLCFAFGLGVLLLFFALLLAVHRGSVVVLCFALLLAVLLLAVKKLKQRLKGKSFSTFISKSRGSRKCLYLGFNDGKI